MEKGKISSLQMAMLLYPAIVATAILSVPSIISKYAQNDLWLSPIVASLMGFVTVFITYKIHKLYPEQTIIQFSESIIGRIPAKIIGFIILSFYIIGTGQIARSYSEFIVGAFLTKTPISVIIASMLFLCALVVRAGIEVLGRITQLFFPLFIVPLLLVVPLLSPDFNLKNLFPILEDGLIPPLKGAITPAGWFTEIFLMIFFLPFLADKKNGMKSGMFTVLVAMLTMVLVNLVVLFVLGPTTPNKVYPLLNAIQYISLADFFENLESIAMAVWIIGAFVKISVFYYVSALGTAQWLNLSDYRAIVWPLGIIMVECSFWSLPSSMELNSYLEKIFPFWAFAVQTILPLGLFLVALARKKQKGNSA